MQQEMQNQPKPSYGGYEGEPLQNPQTYQVYGQKLSVPVSNHTPTAGQRLALAIVSLGMLIFLIFSLILYATLANAPNWAVIPILFILILFSAVAVTINFLFNRNS